MRRDVFQAIADPTRREILFLLSRQPLHLNAIAGEFSQSRPAISKHIRILRECGLLTLRKEGRQRLCEARLHKLNEVSVWVDQYRKFWNKKLDALENYLVTIEATTKKEKKTKKSTVHGRQSTADRRRKADGRGQ